MKGLGVPFRSSGGAVAFLLPTAGRSRFFYAVFVVYLKLSAYSQLGFIPPFRRSMYKYCPPFPSAVFGGSLQVAYKEKSQGRDVGGFLFYRRSAAVAIIA